MPTTKMSARTWIWLTLGLTVLVAGGVAAANATLDVYGLFRDAHGRSLPIYGSERRGKYLLSSHYVPESFDAILIGTSVSANWNTAGLAATRTYNESTDGGNISEEKLIVDQALASPTPPKMALCVIFPYLTDSHELNSDADEMTPRERYRALGSIALFTSYRQMLAERRGGPPAEWNAFGAQQGYAMPERPNAIMRRILEPGVEIAIDPVALADYRALVDGLRTHGARLVLVVPPLSEPLRAPKAAELERYLARMRTIFAPGDLVIDFDAPEYLAFRSDPKNYSDGVHVSPAGAIAIVELLDQRLRSAGAGLR